MKRIVVLSDCAFEEVLDAFRKAGTSGKIRDYANRIECEDTTIVRETLVVNAIHPDAG